jgi:hypothetical protein
MLVFQPPAVWEREIPGEDKFDASQGVPGDDHDVSEAASQRGYFLGPVVLGDRDRTARDFMRKRQSKALPAVPRCDEVVGHSEVAEKRQEIEPEQVEGQVLIYDACEPIGVVRGIGTIVEGNRLGDRQKRLTTKLRPLELIVQTPMGERLELAAPPDQPLVWEDLPRRGLEDVDHLVDFKRTPTPKCHLLAESPDRIALCEHRLFPDGHGVALFRNDG